MPPQASLMPSGWKAMDSTVHPSAASGMISRGSPSFGFHSQAVPSVRQHDANVCESGEKVRSVIGARGPSIGGRSCWVLLSQMCNRESGLAVEKAIQRPSGLLATANGLATAPAGGLDDPVTRSQDRKSVV